MLNSSTIEFVVSLFKIFRNKLVLDLHYKLMHKQNLLQEPDIIQQ